MVAAVSAKEQFDDARQERLQLRVLELEKRLNRFPFLDGTLVEQVVDTTSTRVTHRLGRVPKGVIVACATPVSAVGFSAAQPNDPQNAVHLEASAQATFKLWFW